MAKNLNSISFTVCLLVLVMASTGILKSEAQTCGVGGCPNLVDRVFWGECGPAPFTGTNAECCACCVTKFGSPPVCWAVVEGSDTHCHCYKKK
ncbi:unnamed protein product [Microthlaspi erraticum]|uniref:Bowman-Birk serine protease inhibitors family domain-containing protein n=1 Tax=Microthlaspi erraticum TaxID=1685480 RepID=A0A6D2LHB8_9BRAS|nr:unnamed protein product [Microthlaspi erraticum]